METFAAGGLDEALKREIVQHFLEPQRGAGRTQYVRRRARIEEKLEKLSVADALNAVRFAEVVIVLMDAQKPFEEQDLRIVDLVEREGRALVIGMNKWDLLDGGPGAIRKLRASGYHLVAMSTADPLVWN